MSLVVSEVDKKIKLKLIKGLAIACILLFVGGWFWLRAVGNLYSEFLFLLKHETASGYIYKVESYDYDIEKPESGGQGGIIEGIVIEYKFETKTHGIIYSHVALEGYIIDSLPDLSKLPQFVEIEYLSNNPSQSRIKNCHLDSVTWLEFFWRKLFVGTVFLFGCLSVGYVYLKDVLKESKTTKVPLNS